MQTLEDVMARTEHALRCLEVDLGVETATLVSKVTSR
jgi:hypothetical protein